MVDRQDRANGWQENTRDWAATFWKTRWWAPAGMQQGRVSPSKLAGNVRANAWQEDMRDWGATFWATRWWPNEGDGIRGGGGSFPTTTHRGGGGTFTTGRPNGFDMDERNARYFGGLMEQYSVPDDGGAGLRDFMDRPLPGSGTRRDLVSPEEDAIVRLFYGGGGVRGVLDRAIELSLTDDDEFTRLQMQLVQHGFLAGQPNWGEMDDATVEAITALINGKWRSGADQSMVEYLADRRKAFTDSTFEAMDQMLKDVDAETAAELEQLREQIENTDLTITLASSEALKSDIQTRAKNEIGRALSDAEVQSIIDDVHEQQRKEFWQSPEAKRYNVLRQRWEDAVTNPKDKYEAMLGDATASDLTSVMQVLEQMESGGNPQARNASGAYGLFQFMPETWRNTTRKAGLDPNDRSPENQRAAARWQLAAYFTTFGNWRDVFKAWYAGPGSPSIGQEGRRGTDKNGYPTIESYADKGIRMLSGYQQQTPTAGAGEPGWEKSELPPEMLKSWWKGKNTLPKVSDVADDAPQALFNGEQETWDMNSYLQAAVRESGGVDTDAFTFAKNALDFYSLLGAR